MLILGVASITALVISFLIVQELEERGRLHGEGNVYAAVFFYVLFSILLIPLFS